MDQAWLDELSELLRIPSVSADPAHAGDVRVAAEWVRDFVRRGGGEAEVEPTATQPLVIGSFRASNGNGDAPTVMVYGHFDVQPPAPLDLWESDPFEPTVRGEWLYARGVADDKGQLWALLKAAELLTRENALPVNLLVACDGEEECGGQSIVDFLKRDDRARADACIIFDSAMERRGVPAICTGTRGLVGFKLGVRSGDRDLHSGVFGNAAMNATHALMQAIGALLPRDGRLPDELRAGIVPPSDEERASWAELTPGAEVLKDVGATPYDDTAAGEFYLRTTAEPSVDVNGIIGGKPGVTNTTVPAQASANFTIRLAPGQEPETVGTAAEKLIRAAAPKGVHVDLEWEGVPPGLVSPDEPAVQLAAEAFEQVMGRRPLLARSGGTLPIVPALVDRGIPTILTGIALPESNIHSPNECVLVEYLPLGVEIARELYTKLANLR